MAIRALRLMRFIQMMLGAALAALVLPAPIAAQPQSGSSVAALLGAPATETETPHLRLKTTGGEAPVARGGRVSLFVEVEPKPKMHVYAPEQKQYIPVSLTVSRQPDVTVRAAVFPKGQPMLFGPTGETQVVFSQPFRIEVPVTIAGTRTQGPLTLTGVLEYQACDDQVCYVPRKVAVGWTMVVK
jgi:DsbC/DsbD-like thiol-disulfide interchange protein